MAVFEKLRKEQKWGHQTAAERQDLLDTINKYSLVGKITATWLQSIFWVLVIIACLLLGIFIRVSVAA